MSTPKSKPKKRSFSSFRYRDAFKEIGITQLNSWKIDFASTPASDFFQQHLERLRCFDLGSSEEAKKLLIDAFLVEALQNFKRLKAWKGVALESETMIGAADYLIAEHRAYLEAPLLCVVEAKKDDFEQGAAQCLVEMKACRWINQQLEMAIDILGIVTNGETWKFYKLTIENEAFESQPYAIGDIEAVLGVLKAVFQICEQHSQLVIA